MNGHVEELAELYAVGALEERDRAGVEHHAAGCAACAERLALARESVAAIEALRTRTEPAAALGTRLRAAVRPGPALHPWTAALAVAAAFALALIPAWLAVDRNHSLARMMAPDEAAIARLAQASFHRATFMSPSKRPMNAKVLYGPRGDWYYVVVMNPRPAMQVAYVHAGRMEMLGTVEMHGSSGSLYLPVHHKMEELALLVDGKPVGDAHLVY